MKKLLVGTAAVALGLGLAAPAKAADGVKLGLGGYFMGYVSWVDQDEDNNGDGNAADAIEDVRSFDILRETEVHFSGETTLDNGLTVGFHLEAEADGFSGGAGDSFEVEESYAYFSGAWGRVNFGSEDGAAFLLQVAAPSADANIDGLRQQVQPVNFARTFAGAFAGGLGTPANLRFDYDNALARSDNKITYMTPVFNGFQAGVSYTPDLGTGAASLAGNVSNDQDGDLGSVYEAAARYEGQVGEFGLALGAGYSQADLEDEVAGDNTDDRTLWDVGANVKWSAFNLGAAYFEDDKGSDFDADETVWVVGLDYTTGPFKIGGSYYNSNQEIDGLLAVPAANSGDIETDRWMGGVTYTYGPGMTFRGSIGFIDLETPVALVPVNNDTDATFVMLGTQINF